MKIGLALSGGGIRSMVHLGMMSALDEEGIKFDIVSGTSAGAIGGALYCAGLSPKEVLEAIDSTNYFKILRPALNWRGLLKIENAAELMLKYIPHNRFEKLKMPLVVAATNIKKGKIKYFKKGELIKPVLASCAIPVVFDPVQIDGVPYGDGGLIDNLPVKPIKKKCDFVLGMHCNPIENKYEAKNWKELMERSMLLAISSATYLNKKKCDLFWEPPEIANYNVFEYRKAKEIYEVGYRFAKKQLKTNPFQKFIQVV